MGLRYRGSRAVAARLTPGVRRPGQWLPRREAAWWVMFGPWCLYVMWRPWAGMFPAVLARAGSERSEEDIEFPNLWSKALKQLSLGVEAGKPLPPLPADSSVLKKFPRLLEFLTATQYDNGSPRAPGRLWLDSDLIAFTMTLFEPSGFARVRLRASSLDDLLMLAEKHLGSENPAWEDDQYARDRAAEKKKKK